jgi:hypothetical protein
MFQQVQKCFFFNVFSAQVRPGNDDYVGMISKFGIFFLFCRKICRWPLEYDVIVIFIDIFVFEVKVAPASRAEAHGFGSHQGIGF